MSNGDKKWIRMAVYCRVSTDDQTTEQQLAIMHSEIDKAEGFAVFEESASTRKTRPEKERLIEAVRAYEFDSVLVWKIDRFARDVGELHAWRVEVERLQVGFISFTEYLDTSTPSGRMQFGILAVMAEYERDLIRERIKLKMAHMKAHGQKVSRVICNYDEAKAKRLAPSLSVRELAAALRVSRGTAHILKRRYAAQNDAAAIVVQRAIKCRGINALEESHRGRMDTTIQP